jgi:hypothetical protein
LIKPFLSRLELVLYFFIAVILFNNVLKCTGVHITIWRTFILTSFCYKLGRHLLVFLEQYLPPCWAYLEHLHLFVGPLVWFRERLYQSSHLYCWDSYNIIVWLFCYSAVPAEHLIFLFIFSVWWIDILGLYPHV